MDLADGCTVGVILRAAMELTELSPGFGTGMSGVATDATGRLWGLWSTGGCRSSDDRGAHWRKHPIADKTVYTALAVGPDGRVYVGTERGEIHESHNRGASWLRSTLTGMHAVKKIVATPGAVLAAGARLYRRPSNDLAWLTGSPRSPRVTCLAAAEDGTVYAGFRSGRRAWVARSDDGGARWKEVYVLPATRKVVNALAATGTRVYASTADVTRWGAADCEGLRSTDGGATWTPFAFPADPRQRVGTLWATGNVVYGATTGYDLEDGGAARDAVLMRSADGCRGWEAELHNGEQTLDAAGATTGDVWFARSDGGLLRVRDPALATESAPRMDGG